MDEYGHASLFQFQYGAIRTLQYYKGEQGAQFQFQYGAIRTRDDDFLAFYDKLFQFQYGAIRTACVISTLYLIIRFNSSMVRLELSPADEPNWLLKFQFQYGAIRTWD